MTNHVIKLLRQYNSTKYIYFQKKKWMEQYLYLTFVNNKLTVILRSIIERPVNKQLKENCKPFKISTMHKISTFGLTRSFFHLLLFLLFMALS